ncbi:sensor histidine kinase [Yinghuangia seranimata]|uniref:sensor histidine kinase n=1 Tax=Yinghuangia seranimata TaxID=408067 RepID=UPI00248C9E67|nr:nitrate- and nitrite sensing domain-containing protein [Yinghuangia seranimata]MDI2129916.1 nitrate- and nitrite sensing domain-containing protein [Yinghuangia seranimata]
MKLTRTLTLMVGVPLVVAVGFAGLAVESSISKASDAADLRSLVVASGAAGRLAHELQAERTAATLMLLPASNQDAAEAYRRQVGTTDAEVARYRSSRADVDGAPAEVTQALRAVDAGLAGLGELRYGVQTHRTPLSAAGFSYRILVAGLMDYRSGVAQFAGAPAANAEDLRTASELSRAAESASLQEVAVLRALGPGGFNRAAQQEIFEARAGYGEGLRSFAGSARPEWQSLLEHSLVGEKLARAQSLEDLVARTPADSLLALDPNEWSGVLDARVARLRGVEAEIDQTVLDDVTDIRDHQVWWATGEIAAIVLAIAAAATIVIRLGRKMIRRLRSLQESAHEVAYERLPAAVETLRDPDVLGSATPDEFASLAGAAVKVDGRDEIAEVGDAFRIVFEEAVRLAANLAGERAGTSAILVNLARRGQVQTNDLLRELDRAEEREADPERLERLYAIDHHVNLMRRTHDNLLVLGGEGSARVRDDTPLLDVVRVAAQRIKHYTRVHLPGGNIGVTIAGRATDPLAHLLAELLDNATMFSPPGTPVSVDVGVQGDRAVVHIADQGFGLRADRREVLNARLAGSSSVDLDSVRLMGLTVVSTLAVRLGVEVSLEKGDEGGTVAVVVLPAGVLTSVRRVGRHRAAAADTTVIGSVVAAGAITRTATPQLVSGTAPQGLPESGPAGSPADPLAPAAAASNGTAPRAPLGTPLGGPLGGPAGGVPADGGPSRPARSGWVASSAPSGPLASPSPAAPGSGDDAPTHSGTSHVPHDAGFGHPQSAPTTSGLPRRVPRAHLQEAPATVPAQQQRVPARTTERPRDAGRVADAMAAFASGTRAGRIPGGAADASPGAPDGPSSGEHRAVLTRPQATELRGRELT